MKKLLLLSAAVFASINMYGQGTVNFGNNAASAVTNKVTGDKVIAGATFMAQLWYAPDSAAAPSADAMIPVAGTTTISPIKGLITGGTKIIPGTGGANGTGGGAAWFQIRVWETAYGATWQEATTKSLNGRLAIAGSSDIIKVTTGDPGAVPPALPGSLTAAGLKSFAVDQLVPEPSIIGLGLLGAGSLLFLRRRK